MTTEAPYKVELGQRAVRVDYAKAIKGRKYAIRGRALPLKLRAHFPQLRTVSDALAPIQVTVTGQDQRGSNPKHPESCAMARACTRELGVDGAIIGMGVSYLIQGTHATRFKTPETLAREITTFDRHGQFAVGTYALAAVPESSRLGLYRKAGTHAPGAKMRRQGLVHKTSGVRALRDAK